MNWIIAILLMFGGAVFGFMAALFCVAARRGDELEERVQQIKEVREEIIQEAIDNVEVSGSRSYSDYDVDINKEGTENIQKILERVL